MKPFVLPAFEPGEAFQFDCSEERLVVGGIHFRMQAVPLEVRVRRAFWRAAYPSQRPETLFRHAHAWFRGVARRGTYDNMKTAADRFHKGKGRVANARVAGTWGIGGHGALGSERRNP